MKPFGFERNTERSGVREKLYVTLERYPSKKKKQDKKGIHLLMDIFTPSVWL